MRNVSGFVMNFPCISCHTLTLPWLYITAFLVNVSFFTLKVLFALPFHSGFGLDLDGEQEALVEVVLDTLYKTLQG